MIGVALVLLGGISYGLLATVIKLAYRDGLAPGDVISAQFLFGAALIWTAHAAVAAASRRRRSGAGAATTSARLRLPPRRTLLWLGVAGVSSALTGTLYYLCLRTTDASIGIVLLFQFVWIGIVIDAVLNRKWPGLPHSVAVLLVLAGTALAAGGVGAREAGAAASVDGAGLAYGLASALSYALVLISLGRAGGAVSGTLRGAIVGTLSAVLALAFFPPVFLLGPHVAETSLYGLFLAAFGIVVPIVSFAVGMPRVGGTLGTILASIELPAAVLTAALVLGEPVTSLRWLGVALILAALVLPEIWSRRRRRAAPGASAAAVQAAAAPGRLLRPVVSRPSRRP
ncbi:MAG TPA: DMT family transporter [Stellaceae bacterium]